MSQSTEQQPTNAVELESIPSSSNWQENKLEAETVLNGPELAKGSKPVPLELILRVDSCTGLPKLPIEPVVDSEEEPETPSLTLTSWNFNPQSGDLTGVMSNILSSPTAKRKSVTFEEQGSPKKDTDKTVSHKQSILMGKCKSDSQLPRMGREGEDSGGGCPGTSSTLDRIRTRGRPTSIVRNGRSRSVYIRLQRSTPSVFGDVDQHLPPSAGLHKERTAFNTKSEDKTDRGSTCEGFKDHHGDQEASPIDDECRHFLGRRSSFLYQSDSEDHEEVGASMKRFSRGPSQCTTGHVGDETYVTPFAQILATMHRMRTQYITLTGLPEDTRTPHSRPGWTATASPNLSTDKKFSPSKDKDLALDILEELDWCLKKLETVSSTKSMGNMAKDKFRRLLNRELSQLSEGSRKGAQVAEWVTNITNIDSDVDRAMDTMHNLPASTPNSSFEASLTESLGHHNWVGNQKITSANQTSSCDLIPVFGVASPKMNASILREYTTGCKLLDWNVDVFRFGTATGDNPLICASYVIFKQRNLFTSMNIRPRTFINFMTAIQGLYHSNTYHNALHGTDVFLGSNILLNAKALEGVFTDLEVLATLIAAAVHDVDHPGVSNQFLISVRHGLATLYNDNSVLENHHLATAFKTLQKPDCNILESFESEKILAFRKMVIDLVLATDMAKHLEYLADVKTLLETKKVSNNGILVLDEYSERLSVLQCLLHCADLSNPGKVEPLAVEWTERIIEEFFSQGDKEKELNMTIHPGGDRKNTCIPSCQISFIDYIIFPLWETWAELVYPDSQEVLDNITYMKEYWTAKNEESNSPSEDLSPRSSRSGSTETIQDTIQEMIQETEEKSPLSSEDLHQPSPSQKSPVRRFRKRLHTSGVSEARNSIDLNKSATKLGGSLSLPHSSSLMKLAMAERSGGKPGITKSDEHCSSRLGESTKHLSRVGEAVKKLSQSTESGLNEVAARERRTSFKSAKYLPIAKEVISSVDS